MELLSNLAVNPQNFNSSSNAEGTAESSIREKRELVHKMSENLAQHTTALDDEAHLEEHLLYHTKAIDLL